MMPSAVKEAEINEKIENARKLFYSAVLAKKRSIRRNFLEMNSIANEHALETMPYRAALKKAFTEDFSDFLDKTDQTSKTSLYNRMNSNLIGNDYKMEDDESTMSTDSEWVSNPEDYNWESVDTADLQYKDTKDLYYYFPPDDDEETMDDGDIDHAFVHCDAVSTKKAISQLHQIKRNLVRNHDFV